MITWMIKIRDEDENENKKLDVTKEKDSMF